MHFRKLAETLFCFQFWEFCQRGQAGEAGSMAGVNHVASQEIVEAFWKAVLHLCDANTGLSIRSWTGLRHFWSKSESVARIDLK